ncbi:hypothetical protein [Mesorhizobium sp. B2-3-5]|uniref:hypothetical protein n=1 Tax=Mesorhizobium sp. B2-3-5 TaxID=2589958 RepID=UPI00112CCF03|nr:hypothetical protein [Mesorhizobium sp. B2-3-5]TPM21562.1 hypothetical protein FJ958_26295 [Mesorhizobium sp. B2-3-5]
MKGKVVKEHCPFGTPRPCTDGWSWRRESRSPGTSATREESAGQHYTVELGNLRASTMKLLATVEASPRPLCRKLVFEKYVDTTPMSIERIEAELRRKVKKAGEESTVA